MAKTILTKSKPTRLLLNMGELAQELGVKPTFVYRMKKDGFPMPGSRSTLDWALEWLKANPNFQCYKTLPNTYKGQR